MDPSKEIARRWPLLEWNPHMVRMADAVYEHRLLGITGGVYTSKTTFLTAYALAFFDQAPGDTKVVFLCNTLAAEKMRSLGLAEQRWKEHPVGASFRGTEARIQPAQPFIAGAGVYWVATGSGMGPEVEKSLETKCTNLLVIADDAAFLDPRIPELLVKLNFQRDCFQAVLAGNPDSIFDSFGQWCRPRHGWDQVDLNSQAWDTRIGHCLHLDGEGSLPENKLEHCKSTMGEDSPLFRRMVRGFWNLSKHQMPVKKRGGES
jgi:hypothetical protein